MHFASVFFISFFLFLRRRRRRLFTCALDCVPLIVFDRIYREYRMSAMRSRWDNTLASEQARAHTHARWNVPESTTSGTTHYLGIGEHVNKPR